LETSQVMQNNARLPFWISSSEISEVSYLLGNLIDSGQLHAEDRNIAMEISQELGVATTRFSHSRIPSNLLQHALNVSNQEIPLHLSEPEINFLQKLDIPPHFKVKLNE
jgi:hypothetical protein